MRLGLPEQLQLQEGPREQLPRSSFSYGCHNFSLWNVEISLHFRTLSIQPHALFYSLDFYTTPQYLTLGGE
jgi:hypothetical protein